MTTPNTAFDIIKNPVLIAPNKFKFKSLSDFSCNIAIGCRHGCTFCFSPEVTTIKQEKNYEKNTGLIPQDWVEERIVGQHWGDVHWGQFAFLRTWDEKKFLASLKSAQRAKDEGKLSPDGQAAIMFCTTTDPYQTLHVHGDLAKTKLLADQRRGLVRRSLEAILTKSDLNVRILTRSPLAEQDFDLYKAFGHRLLFGMSLTTLNPTLSAIYEPNAPRPAAKLRTLEKASEQGINIFVALAPTLPDEGEAELKYTIERILPLNPFTIFHEPINPRAENIERIELKGRELGREINSGALKSREHWREYAFHQLSLVEKICDDLSVPEGVLHLWPDKDLGSEAGFMAMKKMQAEREHGGGAFTKALKAEAEALWENEWHPWLQYWHNPAERISAWPKPSSVEAEPELVGTVPGWAVSATAGIPDHAHN